MEKHEIISFIIGILTFSILCIQILPDWYKRWKKDFKIRVNDNVNQFEVFIRFHEKFNIQKIIFLNKKEVYFHKLHPYNGTFLLKTSDIANYHYLVVDKRNLQTLITNNKIELVGGKALFKAVLFTESGDEKEEEFSFVIDEAMPTN